MTYTTDDWRGLYREGWKNEITPAAFTHPAKYARALIRRIYDHCAECGWLREGDGVLDPFGGVALGGLDAMRLGLKWTGVELEPRFVALGNDNIDLWNRRYAGAFAKWGTARLVQGDSRRLLGVLAGEGVLAVSSPPYAQSDQDYKNGWARFHAGHEPLWRDDSQREAQYGETPGQLAALPPGDFNAAVSSPPYADGCRQEGNDHHPDRMEGAAHATARYDAAVASPPFRQTAGGTGVKPGAAPGSPTADPRLIDRHAASNAAAQGYGGEAGQLANMAEGEWEAAVSSPPFETSATKVKGDQGAGWYSGQDLSEGMNRLKDDYAPMADLGAGADFWSAARLIVAQTYAALRPGGHACWVVKGFVRNRQLVDFPGQWRQLCEAVGFVTVHEHRAWVVEDNGIQLAHDGKHKIHRTERKSFFRRLAEKKGSPRIDYETVWCMVRP